MGSKSGSVAVRVGLVLFSSLFLFLITRSNVEIGYGQTGLPNLKVTSITLTDTNGAALFSIDSPGQKVNISVEVANAGTGAAQGFDVQFLTRKEEDQNFGTTNSCQFNNGGGFCTNITLQAGSSIKLLGSLDTTNLQTGRYIIRAKIVPNNVVQTSVDDDILETILLIGVSSPEIHPISLTFNPPSPAPQGSQVTVRVEIENTGKPASPSLQVKFEYCLENPTCVDTDLRSDGFLEGTGGIKSVSSTESTALSQAQSIVVTNVLNTSGLAVGRYLFKVTVTPIGVSELDPNNDDISTRFSIGSSGLLNSTCQISGKITTLADGLSTQQVKDNGTINVDMLYVSSEDTDGDIKVHAMLKSDLDTVAPTDACPEIPNSPISISGGNGQIKVSTFAVDSRSHLLYVGLNSGNIWVFDTSQANQLASVSKTGISGSSLLSFSPRQASSTTGQVFIGTQNQQLLRMTVTRSGSSLILSTPATCLTMNQPIKNVQIFQGKTYFTTGNILYRMDETTCSSSALETVFTAAANSTIASMAIGKVTLPLFPSVRIVIGLDNGTVHVLGILGTNLTNSPFSLGKQITAVAINDGGQATASQREVAYVSTLDGQIAAIQLRTGAKCTFQTTTKQPINVLGVYAASKGASLAGLAFAGSDDQSLYIVDDNCGDQVKQTITTQGSVQANMVFDELKDIFGPTGVRVFYGGGSGLFSSDVLLP